MSAHRVSRVTRVSRVDLRHIHPARGPTTSASNSYSADTRCASNPRRIILEVRPSRQESYQRCVHSCVGSHQMCGHPDKDPTRCVSSRIVIVPDVYTSRCWPVSPRGSLRLPEAPWGSLRLRLGLPGLPPPAIPNPKGMGQPTHMSRQRGCAIMRQCY